MCVSACVHVRVFICFICAFMCVMCLFTCILSPSVSMSVYALTEHKVAPP